MPTGCTHFRLVYGKACHLPVEIEHKAYWALNIHTRTPASTRKELRNGMTLGSEGIKTLNLETRTVEITDKNGISFKVNGQRLKKYYDGSIDTDDKEVIEFEENTTLNAEEKV
ncbi:hypothetical protein Tco_0814696 [Tanacetum coccineum]